METIYGMRVVPERDENQVRFGKFEGIVICSSSAGEDINLVKAKKTESDYVLELGEAIPDMETIRPDIVSGKDLLDFLIKKANQFANNYGFNGCECAISENLAKHIERMDLLTEKYSKNQGAKKIII